MARRIQEYVRYTKKELDTYTAAEGSCVKKINRKLHLLVGPHVLNEFKKSLMDHITRHKIGTYDTTLEGIILDLRNIKVLGTTAALRADDARLHIDISADCYVFQPLIGAVVTGIVRYVSAKILGIIIYRVYSVNIRLTSLSHRNDVEMGQNVQFRIKTFNLQHLIPYIEGELVACETNDELTEEVHVTNTKIRFESDSGIENNGNEELSSSLNNEGISDDGGKSLKRVKKKDKNKDKSRKRKSVEPTDSPMKREFSRESSAF